jgi:hypothetical protein
MKVPSGRERWSAQTAKLASGTTQAPAEVQGSNAFQGPVSTEQEKRREEKRRGLKGQN